MTTTVWTSSPAATVAFPETWRRPARSPIPGRDRAAAPSPSSSWGFPPLVAMAHGSRDPRAAVAVAELVELVRERRPELTVVTSYLDHAPPTPVQALNGVAGDVAVVVPLLLTAAYHAAVDIPRALAAVAARRPRLRVHAGAVLGPHPLLRAALERRLAEVGVPAGDPRTAVVLCAAGSRDAAANAVVGGMAAAWRARGWWSVVPAHASAAAPSPAQAVAALRDAGAPRVVVASYFVAPGRFADAVRTQSYAAGAAAVSEPLGAAPELADLVLLRYREALTSTAAKDRQTAAS